MAAKTSVTVDFQGYLDNGLGGGPLLELSNKESDSDKKLYFRGHGTSGYTLKSTSGSISKTQTGKYKFTSEFLTFSGQTSKPLRYPQATAVTLSIQGFLVDVNGNVVSNPTVRYNAASNAAQVDEGAVYGIVLAEYSAPYDLWLATFGGTCPTVTDSDAPRNFVSFGTGSTRSYGSPDDDEKYQGRTPMLVIAYKADSTTGIISVDAELNMNPPPCEDTNGDNFAARSNDGSGANPSKPRLLEDPDYPAQLVYDTVLPIAGKARLRAYPYGTYSTQIEGGRITDVSSGAQYEEVVDVLNFSGSGSSKTSFQINGSPNVNVIGFFRDIWGRTFTPRIRLPGQEVRSVRWINQSTYTDPRLRTLEEDEIGIVDFSNVLMPCYGLLEATYNTSYRSYEVNFDYELNLSGIHTLKDAFVVVTDRQGDPTGSQILLKGPLTKGKK